MRDYPGEGAESERERERVMTFGLPCLCKDRWLIMVANAQVPYSRLSSLFLWNLIAVLLRVFTDSGGDESLRPVAAEDGQNQESASANSDPSCEK